MTASVYVCPVEGCNREFREPQQLSGHIGKTQETDPAHEWDRLSVSHDDVSSARQAVPTIGDYTGGSA